MRTIIGQLYGPNCIEGVRTFVLAFGEITHGARSYLSNSLTKQNILRERPCHAVGGMVIAKTGNEQEG
ncbi:MAG TPA: hypothetical protein VLA93_16365 [Pyrinomonadaceae bacterium]|nr:hypothetical protein [Pyrinomonadaceae bacterium]